MFSSLFVSLYFLMFLACLFSGSPSSITLPFFFYPGFTPSLPYWATGQISTLFLSFSFRGINEGEREEEREVGREGGREVGRKGGRGAEEREDQGRKRGDREGDLKHLRVGERESLKRHSLSFLLAGLRRSGRVKGLKGDVRK